MKSHNIQKLRKLIKHKTCTKVDAVELTKLLNSCTDNEKLASFVFLVNNDAFLDSYLDRYPEWNDWTMATLAELHKRDGESRKEETTIVELARKWAKA